MHVCFKGNIAHPLIKIFLNIQINKRNVIILKFLCLRISNLFLLRKNIITGNNNTMAIDAFNVSKKIEIIEIWKNSLMDI